MPPLKLNAEIIAAAIEGFESQKRRMDAQIGELRAMLSGGRTEGPATAKRPHGSAKSVPQPVAVWQKARRKDGQQ